MITVCIIYLIVGAWFGAFIYGLAKDDDTATAKAVMGGILWPILWPIRVFMSIFWRCYKMGASRMENPEVTAWLWKLFGGKL